MIRGFIATTVCVLLAFASAVAAERPVKRVLFIGIDGVRTDALRRADAPRLHKLIGEGAFSDATQIVGPRNDKADTVSGPGWSNLLTGVWADKHGVIDNSFKGANYDKFPHVFVRVRQTLPQAKLYSASTWEPIHQRIVGDAAESKHFPTANGESHHLADAQAVEQAERWLSKDDPDMLFVYIGNVDETGHKHGFHPTVTPYMEAIAMADGLVGKVLDALYARPNFAQENWLVLVSTDHGGIGTNHGGGRTSPEINTIWLIVHGAGVKPGAIDGPTAQVDVVATALHHMSIATKPDGQLDGRPVGIVPGD